MAGNNDNQPAASGEFDGTAFDFGTSSSEEPKESLPDETNTVDTATDDAEYYDEDGNKLDSIDDLDDVEFIDQDSVPAKEPDVDPRDAEITQLKEQISNLMQMLQTNASAPKPQQQVETPSTEAGQQNVAPIVSDEEFSKIIDEGDSKTFTSVMQRVQEHTAKTILTNLPRIISGMINQEVTQKQVIDNFYQANDDLVAHKQHVALVGQELAKAHPEWQTDKLLAETAIEFRKRFNLSKTVPPKTPGNPAAPAAKRKIVRVPSKKGQPAGVGGKQGGPVKAAPAKDKSEMTNTELQDHEMDSLFVGLNTI